MLLTRLIRRIRSEEDGVALAAVIGLMATGLLVTALVAATVVSATEFTSSTRAGVQSQAAAEAGIAIARAGLIDGTCAAQPVTGDGAPIYQSATGETPSYEATVWRADGSGGWAAGCPLGLGSEVRILSTGYATAIGSGGVDSGDVTHLEAVLSAAGTPDTILAVGPAVYAYNAGAFGNGGQLVSTNGSTPDVIVATGDVRCDNNFDATANLVVNGGTLAVDNGCDITGNVWASGRISFVNSGQVGGFAIGDGVSMANSSRVQQIWSYADVTTTGNVTVPGQIKSQSLSLGGGTFGGTSYIYGGSRITNAGATNVTGTVYTESWDATPPSWWSGLPHFVVQNPISTPTFVSDLPPTPIVPDWIDFGSDPDHFTTATWTGFSVYTMGTSCNASDVAAAVASFGTDPGLIDGRACSGALNVKQNNTITVHNDLAIMADAILFDNQGSLAASGGEYRAWLINPDYVANGVPDCQTGESLGINNNASFTGLDVLIYSPCTVTTVAGITIDGQIFAGSATMGNNSTLAFAPVGLPGYNLATGTPTGSTSTEANRVVVAVRNVAEGN